MLQCPERLAAPAGRDEAAASSPAQRERYGLASADVPPATVSAPKVILAAATGEPPAAPAAEQKPSAALPPDDVVTVIQSRCSMCHAPEPLWPGLASPPNGALLDTPEHIARFAPAIRVQAVLTHAMPPNNITSVEPEERQELAKWLATVH